MKKEESLQEMMESNWISICKQMNLGPYFSSCITINHRLKWTEDLKCNTKNYRIQRKRKKEKNIL